jgi:hypothetical protein
MDTARPHRFALQGAVTKTVTTTLAPVAQALSRYRELVITFLVTAMDRTTGDELADLHITTENDAGASWDLCHFPQIATTGVKTFVARLRSDLLPQNVSTATPGTAAVESGTLTVYAAATHAVGSLGAGLVRHGAWGDKIGYILTLAGTTPSISFSISVEAR